MGFLQELAINVHVHQVFNSFYVSLFCTLLWINEYEFQFCSHDDIEHICTKMWVAMGASVHALILIKSYHSHGSKLRPSIEGVLENTLNFQQS